MAHTDRPARPTIDQLQEESALLVRNFRLHRALIAEGLTVTLEGGTTCSTDRGLDRAYAKDAKAQRAAGIRPLGDARPVNA